MTTANASARNIPFCPPNARPMNSSSSVRAVSRNAVLKVFPIVVVTLFHWMLRFRARCMCPNLGISRWKVGTASPRYIGISDLEENSRIIYLGQLVTGKVFRNKELKPQLKCLCALMIRLWGFGCQGTRPRRTVTQRLRVSGFREIGGHFEVETAQLPRLRKLPSRGNRRSVVPPLRGCEGQKETGHPRLTPWAAFFRRFAPD